MTIHWPYIDKLLNKSNLYQWEEDAVIGRLIEMEKMDSSEFTEQEYSDIIKRLHNAELDPITHGKGHRLKDILRHLKKLA